MKRNVLAISSTVAALSGCSAEQLAQLAGIDTSLSPIDTSGSFQVSGGKTITVNTLGNPPVVTVEGVNQNTSINYTPVTSKFSTVNVYRNAGSTKYFMIGETSGGLFGVALENDAGSNYNSAALLKTDGVASPPLTGSATYKGEYGAYVVDQDPNTFDQRLRGFVKGDVEIVGNFSDAKMSGIISNRIVFDSNGNVATGISTTPVQLGEAFLDDDDLFFGQASGGTFTSVGTANSSGSGNGQYLAALTGDTGTGGVGIVELFYNNAAPNGANPTPFAESGFTEGGGFVVAKQ